jgi:chloride channel 3/4/5
VLAADRHVQIISDTVMRSVTEREVGSWTTTDWNVDREEAANDELKEKRRSDGHVRFDEDDDSGSMFFIGGSLAAVLSGILMGLCAVMIEVCTLFVSSIRIGVCVDYFWLNRELCCPVEEDCEGFQTWGKFFGGEAGHHNVATDFAMYSLWGVFFAGTAAFLCKHFAIFAAGGGINEVKTIVSGHVAPRYFNAWTMFVKALCVSCSTGSGLAVGKEGPFVHLGACSSDVIGRLFGSSFRNGVKRRELISAGAGGGLAVAFGAPIGGVVFAIEEISSFFTFRGMLHTLMCGVAAVLTLKKFDIMHTGKIVQFGIDYRHRWYWFEVPAFALIGAFGGLVGALYNVVNCWVAKNWRKKYVGQRWQVTEVVALVLISNTINFFVPLSKGGMLELLSDMFQDCQPNSRLEVCAEDDHTMIWYLILAGVSKCLLSMVSVGCCVPAGLLVPSLVIGALFGRAFGIFMNVLQTTFSDNIVFNECSGLNLCVIPGAYAIVGAAAVLTGVTRMTVCLAVIMFELTGGIQYLVPVIVAILSAKVASEAVGVDSIYELNIEMSRLPYLDPKKEFNHDMSAYDVYRDEKLHVIHANGWTMGRLNAMLEQWPYKGFPIVASPTDMTFQGYITRTVLVDAMQQHVSDPNNFVTHDTKVRFSEFAPARNDDSEDEEDEISFHSSVETAVVQVSPTTTVARILNLFKSLGSRLLVVTKASKVEGIITKKGFISFMHDVEMKERAEEEALSRGEKVD